MGFTVVGSNGLLIGLGFLARYSDFSHECRSDRLVAWLHNTRIHLLFRNDITGRNCEHRLSIGRLA